MSSGVWLKRCTKCNLDLPLDNFPKNRNQCKVCKYEYLKAWRRVNHERYGEINKRWIKNNPWYAKSESVKAYRLAYYRRHQELYRARGRVSSLRYYHANPKARERARLAAARRRKENPELARAKSSFYRPKYLSINKAKQEAIAGRPRPSICEICDRPGKIVFDHCHATGKFRGWLCSVCNLALGQVKDSPELLLKMALYLERPQESEAQAA